MSYVLDEKNVQRPTLYRTVGIIALLHATLGLLFGVLTVVILPQVDFAKMADEITDQKLEKLKQRFPKMLDEAELSQAEKEEAMSFLTYEKIKEIGKIATTSEFKTFLLIGGIVFNILLAIVGYRVILLRQKNIPFLILLMGIFFIFSSFTKDHDL